MREDDERDELGTVAQRGFAVCAISLRGYMESSPAFPSSCPLGYERGGGLLRDEYSWASLILGNPVLGQQVWDFLRCLDFLESRADVDSHQIHAAGLHGGGLVCLLGAILDDRPRALLCDRMIADFRSVVDSEDYRVELSWLIPGLLRDFDLPDLVATLAPRRCSLLNTINARGRVLPEPALRARFRLAMDRYSRAGSAGNLQLITLPEEPKSRVLLDWLRDS